MHWFMVSRADSIEEELDFGGKGHTLSRFLILVGIGMSFLIHFRNYEGSLGHIFVFLF